MKRWKDEFKELYPILLGSDGSLDCTYSKEKKLWECKLGDKLFNTEVLRISTEKPLMGESFLLEDMFEMGGLTGSHVECRSVFGKKKGEDKFGEVHCILSGI